MAKLKDIPLFDELRGGVQATAEIFFFSAISEISLLFLPPPPNPSYAPSILEKKKGCEALSRRAPCKEAIKSFAL